MLLHQLYTQLTTHNTPRPRPRPRPRCLSLYPFLYTPFPLILLAASISIPPFPFLFTYRAAPTRAPLPSPRELPPSSSIPSPPLPSPRGTSTLASTATPQTPFWHSGIAAVLHLPRVGTSHYLRFWPWCKSIINVHFPHLGSRTFFRSSSIMRLQFDAVVSTKSSASMAITSDASA